ncbi:MAG: TonB family protein [Caldimonas sp.]
MAALAAADRSQVSAPSRHRHLAQGIAAAGVLSVAVHAAVLFAGVGSGSSSATAAPPPAPPLQTRLIALAEPVVQAAPEAAAVATPAPTAVEPAPRAEAPELASVAPAIDREATLSRSPALPSLPAPTPVPDPPPASRPVTTPTASPPVADTPPVVAPPAPTLTYYGSMGLDPPPRPLSDIEQLVPAAAGSRGGTVVLRMYINEQGTVDKAEVLRSMPPGVFDAAALEAASRARFSPGYLAGVPVKSQVTYEMKWGALGSGAESGGRTY